MRLTHRTGPSVAKEERARKRSYGGATIRWTHYVLCFLATRVLCLLQAERGTGDRRTARLGTDCLLRRSAIDYVKFVTGAEDDRAIGYLSGA
jgi:hypothetical protein